MTTRPIVSILLLTVLCASACATHRPAPPRQRDEPPWPDSLDAVIAAPDHHRILLENDRVRVLEVTLRPHEKEPLHAHRWPSVLYIDRAGDFRDYDSQGRVIFDSRTAAGPLTYPATQWLGPQAPHAVENLSDEPLHLIRVELKR
jgi:hypothetical protein